MVLMVWTLDVRVASTEGSSFERSYYMTWRELGRTSAYSSWTTPLSLRLQLHTDHVGFTVSFFSPSQVERKPLKAGPCALCSVFFHPDLPSAHIWKAESYPCLWLCLNGMCLLHSPGGTSTRGFLVAAGAQFPSQWYAIGSA